MISNNLGNKFVNSVTQSDRSVLGHGSRALNLGN